jgi:hypothetical protein
MTQTTEEKKRDERGAARSDWGPKLFIGTFVALLAFFYWLLIYSGGVVISHG